METALLTFPDDYGKEKQDQLDSSKIIDDFNSFILKSNYKVYGLVGAWGTGKTAFIKMWKKKIESDNNIIYIDANSYDYYSDAFLVLYNNIYKYIKKLEEVKPKDLKIFNSAAKKYISRLPKIAGNLIIPLVLDSTIGSNATEKLVTAFNEAFIDKTLQKSQDEEETLKKLIESLNSITAKLGSELIIIIDELDRCKPSFALEMLEKIKHIFLCSNLKFILVYNSDVIANIVEKEYGLEKGTGNIYLKKYIEVEYIFKVKEINYKLFLNAIREPGEYLDEYMYLALQDNYTNILKIFSIYNFSIRDVERFIASLKKSVSIRVNVFGSISDNAYLVILFELYRIVDEKELNSLFDYYSFNEKANSVNLAKPTFDALWKIYRKGDLKYIDGKEDGTERNSLIDIMIKNRYINRR